MFENYSPYMTVANVAEVLLVEKHSVYKLIEDGKLEAVRVGERNWRITKESLIQYVLEESGIHIDKEEAYDYI